MAIGWAFLADRPIFKLLCRLRDPYGNDGAAPRLEASSGQPISRSRIMSDDPQKNTPARENRIRERAYHLWEADGRPEGREQEYWEQAEAMVGKEESEE
jgi:Protein of unknown function (DUF2934)